MAAARYSGLSGGVPGTVAGWAKAATATSANGLTRTITLDRDGNGLNDLTEVDATVVNGDGSRVKTVTRTNQDGSLRDKSVTTTSVALSGSMPVKA